MTGRGYAGIKTHTIIDDLDDEALACCNRLLSRAKLDLLGLRMCIDVAQRLAKDALDRCPVSVQSIARIAVDRDEYLRPGPGSIVGQQLLDVRCQLRVVRHPQARNGVTDTRQATDRGLFGFDEFARHTIGI